MVKILNTRGVEPHVPRERGGVVGVYPIHRHPSFIEIYPIHRYTTNSPNIPFIEVLHSQKYSTREKLGEGEYTIFNTWKEKEGGGGGYKKKLGKFI